MQMRTMAKEVHDEIGKDIQGIHPWQYQKLNLVSLNYEAILEDILTYWNQDARFREGFKVDNDNIYIPNFFTKVNGIHKNKNDYVKFVQYLKDAKNTLFLDKNLSFYNILDSMNVGMGKVENFLFEKKEYEFYVKKYQKKNEEESDTFYYPISRQNILKYKFLGYTIESKYSTFQNLTSYKQEQLIRIMNKISEEKKDEWSKTQFESFYSICFSLPENIISLINNYDYSFEIPKIIFIGDNINWETMIVLSILNEFSFDILLLQPSGKSNIEKYMDINELSLGYFVDNFDIKTNLLTKKEKKDIEKEEKSKVREKTRRKHKENFDVVKNDSIFNTINISLFVLSLVLAFTLKIGWVNTLLEFAIIIAFILELIFCDENDISFRFLEFYVVNTIVLIVIIIITLFARFVVWLPNDINTTTKNGYIQIEEDAIDGNDGFVMKYKGNAIKQDGSSTMYCYIENNSQNTQNMYFKLFIGNTEIYKSSTIEPFNYVPQISLNDSLPVGDTKITIKFYSANNENVYSTEDEDEDNEILLGEGSFTCHVYDDYKEYKEAEEKYNLEE